MRAGARVIEFERRLTQQSGLEPITNLPDSNTFAAQLKDHLKNAKEFGIEGVDGAKLNSIRHV